MPYLGPGFLVTVGFLDPRNWAANMVAGSQYGPSFLWRVTLSTLMLIILQHRSAIRYYSYPLSAFSLLPLAFNLEPFT